MESMRNLRGSLPPSGSRTRQARSPTDLLQTFKQAALNVTNLYRQANEEIALERRSGYQDAIYELLSFLDKENIGLGDGEGWRIRQWATEKQQLGPEREATSEGEDNPAEERDNSPAQEEEQQAPTASSPLPETLHDEVRATPSVPLFSSATTQHHNTVPPSGEFTYRSNHSYPEIDMQVSNVPADQQQINRITHPRTGTASRSTRRGNHVGHRSAIRSSRLGPGAGSKRKEHFGELFGLSNLGDGKDPFSGPGPKRPRPL